MAAKTPILNELSRYCRYCLEDKRVTEYEDYISGKAHKWACWRFLGDIERAKRKDCYFYWDEEEAKKIVDWFALLRHTKGELAGQPIILNSWQKFILCQVYGWRKKSDKRRRFKKSFTEVARKNAKSQMESGVALYEIGPEAARNGEMVETYTAGTKREQSKVVFAEAGNMLKGSPLLQKFDVRSSKITCKATKGELKPLSKDDGKSGDGSNPALLVLDEYHQHKTTEFYDLAMGSNSKEPLLMIITTAGMDLTYPCYTTEYQYCKKVLDPDVDVANDEYLIDILELDPEDYSNLANLEDRRLWHKANPVRMTYQAGIDKIASDYVIAVEQPEHMTAFLTKMLDIWVQLKKDQYMDMGKWKECGGDLPISLEGAPAYWGFDMSAKLDLTSVALVIPYQTDEVDETGEKKVKYWQQSHSFIPNEERLREHIIRDKVPYDAWERAGWLTVQGTQIIDQAGVMKYVIDFSKEHKLDVKCFCFDPANAGKMMMDLDKIYGGAIPIEEVYQSHRSLNEATNGFREQVYDGNVVHEENPLMSYAMSNAVIRQNNGMIKIDKDASTKRIDPVDATLAAFKLALYHQFDEEDYSSYVDSFLDDMLGVG
jgi:phage terminase large subunit-like protein